MLTTVRVKGVPPSRVSKIHEELDVMKMCWRTILENSKSFKKLKERMVERHEEYVGYKATPKLETDWKPRVLRCVLQKDNTYSMEIEAPRWFMVRGMIETPRSDAYPDSKKSIVECDFTPDMSLYRKLYKLLGLM